MTVNYQIDPVASQSRAVTLIQYASGFQTLALHPEVDTWKIQLGPKEEKKILVSMAEDA